MEQNQVEVTGDAQQEIKEVQDLRASIDSLVETITEQVAKEEEEKLLAEEVQAEQEKLLAEEQAKAEKLTAEEQNAQKLTVEESNAAEEEFRSQVIKALSDIDANMVLLNESIVEQKKIELHNNEMFSSSLGNIKQTSDLATIFLCLIPLFIVYKWLSEMFDGAFR